MARRLALGVIAFLCVLAPVRASAPELDPRSLRELGWYIHDSTTYFKGTLPLNVYIYQMHDQQYSGYTEYSGYDHLWHIGINPEANPTVAEAHLTLLHEECHVSLDPLVVPPGGPLPLDKHGSLWKACMRRLAAAGAMDELW